MYLLHVIRNGKHKYYLDGRRIKPYIYDRMLDLMRAYLTGDTP